MTLRHLVFSVLGAAATALIVLATPLLLAERSSGQSVGLTREGSGIGELSPSAPAGYAGSSACAGCHAGESRDWRDSHHAKAMAIPTEATVRGDFSGAEITVAGSRGRFFGEDGKYLVETEGADGKPAVFTVSHTFGWEPLQQYLVALPDGRLQALPWAWDTRPREQGGQRWFHVYGEEAIPLSDPRHWTKALQNWNHMCAECHSTAFDKGYDLAKNSFRSTFSEISVGCESCHGPGAKHIAWASTGVAASDASKGFAATRPPRPIPDWSINPATGSPAKGVARAPGDEVETCARCHSRRGQIASDWAPGRALGATHLPVFLTPDLFEDDGMMRDEVFNDHSFKQSLMYAKGVTCGDCHNPHSGQLKAAGATVCAQCHMPEKFAAVTHTGHQPGAGAPDCISCHMPARTYMVVDRRHDHSFRIPRPDLSVKLGTPNACTDCHKDQGAAWAAAAVERWHGATRQGHQRYAEAFHAARTGNPDAREHLMAIASDPNTPGIARATALTLLPAWPSARSDAVIVAALADPEPMARVAALRGIAGEAADRRWRLGAPSLADPVLIVRMAAAELLADQPLASLSAPDRARLEATFAEYEASHMVNADRAEAHAALGLFRQRQGRLPEAEAAYRTALRLEPGAVIAAVNLADLYRVQGREREADELLRRAVTLAPDAAMVQHALGLSLIRQKRYADAMNHLARAVTLDPGSPRFAYVYAVALQSTGKPAEGERILRDAAARNPADVDILSALLQTTLRAGKIDQAAPLAARLSALRPDNPEFGRLAAGLNPKP